jgi:hypothetical protein
LQPLLTPYEFWIQLRGQSVLRVSVWRCSTHPQNGIKTITWIELWKQTWKDWIGSEILCMCWASIRLRRDAISPMRNKLATVPRSSKDKHGEWIQRIQVKMKKKSFRRRK